MTPTRQKKNGQEYGSYRCYDPRVGRVISLGTEDFSAAQRMADELAKFKRRRGRPAKNSLSVTDTESAGKPDEVVDVHTTTDTVTEPIQQPTISAKELLDSWTAETSVTGGNVPNGSNGTVGDTVSSTSGGNDSLPSLPPVTTISRKPKPVSGLSPEQAQKIGAGLKKIVTKVNIIAAGMCVDMFGRDPAPLEDDEIDLVVLGWEMMLEQYFTKSQPKPWMVLLAGNVMMVMAMYLRGEPKKTEDVSHQPPLQ